MRTEVLLQALANGLLQGGIYAIIAAGLTLIYGVMKVVNFAHAEFITLGMFLSYFAFTTVGLNPYLVAIFILAFVFFLGASFQHMCIRPALRHPQINQILITIGLSTLMIGVMQVIWGADNLVVRLSWARAAMDIGDIRVTYTRLIAFVVAMSVALGFWWFLKSTKAGMAVRAASQDADSARLMGINVERIHLATFGMGSALAALAGVLIAPVFFMNPAIGIELYLLPSFVIVVLGTMGNFMGALIGGLIIGVVESMGGLLLGSSLRQLASLTIFVLILLFLPRGLFGGRGT